MPGDLPLHCVYLKTCHIATLHTQYPAGEKGESMNTANRVTQCVTGRCSDPMVMRLVREPTKNRLAPINRRYRFLRFYLLKYAEETNLFCGPPRPHACGCFPTLHHEGTLRCRLPWCTRLCPATWGSGKKQKLGKGRRARSPRLLLPSPFLLQLQHVGAWGGCKFIPHRPLADHRLTFGQS